ncbi:hypothetical protein N7528_001781 [Penicillium herquei]|nr:hypothetical protein N7528_001781 [Penicillium herquei]
MQGAQEKITQAYDPDYDCSTRRIGKLPQFPGLAAAHGIAPFLKEIYGGSQQADGRAGQTNGVPKGIANMEQYQEFMAKSPEDQQKYLDSQK